MCAHTHIIHTIGGRNIILIAICNVCKRLNVNDGVYICKINAIINALPFVPVLLLIIEAQNCTSCVFIVKQIN